MIITKEIEIKTTNKNIGYYKTIYPNIKSGDIIKVLPVQLIVGSHEKIEVICDICGKVKLMEYRIYYNLTKNNIEKYYCNTCKWIKTKETNLEKYGVDNTFKLKKDFIQTTKTKEKRIKTNIERYGVISYLKLLPNNHNKNHNKLKETVSINNSKNFFEKVKIIHNDNFIYLSNYIKSDLPIDIKCKKCGNIFKQRPKDHLHNKQGCPTCKESKGEREIRTLLDKNNIIYISQKMFDDCKNIKKLSFDFYLPEYNICIEYDGEQHYKSFKYFGGDEKFKLTQHRDHIKNEYCDKNGIKLIRIKYNENIEEKWIQLNLKY